jgi:hypothetical protein
MNKKESNRVNKNFMLPQHSHHLILKDREKYAVTLRKNRQKAVIQLKRRKII